MYYIEKVKRAVGFATEKHRNQVRKGTDIPYILHPLEALEISSSITDDENVLCAAVLHDVLEDTDVESTDLEEMFGWSVALLVMDESEDKREDLPVDSTWKLRKTETLRHFEHASRDAKIVALGDKLSNIRAIHRDYDEIGDKLWERFNCKDKAEQGWYYRSLSKQLSELSDTEAWIEYDAHVDAVFGKSDDQ